MTRKQPDESIEPRSEEAVEEFVSSTPNSGGPDGAAGGMGVSSERVGDTGEGEPATDGLRDVSPVDTDEDAVDRDDLPPEQRPDVAESNPDGQPPKAGYDSRHQDSDEAQYEPGRDSSRTH